MEPTPEEWSELVGLSSVMTWAGVPTGLTADFYEHMGVVEGTPLRTMAAMDREEFAQNLNSMIVQGGEGKDRRALKPGERAVLMISPQGLPYRHAGGPNPGAEPTGGTAAEACGGTY